MKALNNKFVKAGVDIVWYLVVFAGLQAVMLQLAILIGNHAGIEQGISMAIGTALSGIATIGLFAWRGWSPYSRTYISTRPWAALLWVCPLAFGSILPSEWLLETMDVEVPDEMARIMTQIIGTPWGYLAIGILAPIAEEMVFRGAILRRLADAMEGRKKWLAISVSAIVFGALHGNVPQFIHATVIGLLLGWMYIKTGSIVPGIVFHWINNSIAFVAYHMLPQADDMKIIDLFGGNPHSLYMALAFSMCIFIPSLLELRKRL